MTRETIKEILTDLHEDVDFEQEKKLVDKKILDSFDLVALVTELGEEFHVDIKAKDFVAENFNDLDSLTDMIIQLQNK